MADSYEWIFIYLEDITVSLGYLKGWSRDFQNDCCRPWTKKPFKNSYSRQLRIVNAVVSWSPAGRIDWPKSVFLQDKVTLFETMNATMNEVNRDKAKVPDYFFRNVSLVCFTAELDEQTDSQAMCTCIKLIIKILRLHTCMRWTNNWVLVFMF